MRPNPDRQSIFGDTYDGVPNNEFVHRHPWPTRYHGPIFTQVMASQFTFRPAPWSVPGYGSPGGMILGDGAHGVGCADAGPDAWCNQNGGMCKCGASGMGALVDGPPLLSSFSGSTWLDVVLGAAVGFAAAPDSDKALGHAVAGAVAVGIGGTIGLIGLLGAEVVFAHREGGLHTPLNR